LGYSRSQKPTITNRARSTDTSPVRFPSRSTDSSSATQHEHTQCRVIQARTRRQLSALATQPPSKNNTWWSTRSSRRATMTILASKRQARSSFSAHSTRSGQRCSGPTQKTLHWLWRFDGARDDQPPLCKNSDQDDAGSEA
jgi:hypothetical protein